MNRNSERKARLADALREANWAALVCTLPSHVLLLAGYWPVIGASIAIATRDGQVLLLVPEDELLLARRGWADIVETFRPGSLDVLTDIPTAARVPLARLARPLATISGCIGYEHGALFEPASYVSMHLYGRALEPLLRYAFPDASLVSADALLARLCAVKTTYELERIRQACAIAERAFLEGTSQMRVGLSETEVATLFRGRLSTVGVGAPGVERADGFVFCMSGVNAAEAYGAYARSRAATLVPGQLALVHCNSYVDGYWTDITRTYCLGEADAYQRRLYDAVLEARAAVLSVIRPGLHAAEVDQAVRTVLASRGFGSQFKHGTGHGVGFAAIDHNAQPRLHPRSNDILETGMVFNVEPAIYLDGYGGLRHCDVVALTDYGVEVLTPFQSDISQLTVQSA